MKNRPHQPRRNLHIRSSVTWIGLIIVTMTLWPAGFVRAAQEVTWINVAAEDANLLNTSIENLSPNARQQLIVFNLRSGISAAKLKEIGESVRTGAALLVLMDSDAGKDGYSASFMLPTMAWSWQNKEQGALQGVDFDLSLFGATAGTDLSGLVVPYVHEIRPFSAVERGQSRYDEFERLLHFDSDDHRRYVPPGSNLWTRPLINRDWTVRARVAGIKGLPLLITGRYGRGRVAVFASGGEVLDALPPGKAFWSSTLNWLTSAEATTAPAAAVSAISSPNVIVDREKRLLHVSLSNPSLSALQVNVIGRVMTWEPCLIGDVQQAVSIPANGTAAVDLPLPVQNETSYAAVAARDVYQVRLGVLSADGSTLLNESRIQADLRPPLLATLTTDDVRTVKWPFDPAPEFAPPNRMGIPLSTYAYRPGQTVHATFTFDNGTRNLAKQATVVDETTPANPTTEALNDGFAMAERTPDWYLHANGAWVGKPNVENVVRFNFAKPVLVNAVVLVGAPDAYRNQDRKNPTDVIIEIDGREVARDATLIDRFRAERGRVRLAFDAVRASSIRLRLPWQAKPPHNAVGLGDVEVWGTDSDEFPPEIKGKLSLGLRDVASDTLTPAGEQEIDLLPGSHQTVTFDVPTPKTDGRPAYYRLEGLCNGQTIVAPIITLNPSSVLASMDSLRGKSAEIGFIVTRGFRNIFDIGTGTAELPAPWGTPDDLVWAYERGLKENGPKALTIAGKLFVTENDFRHYSTQWHHFVNGESFYDVAAPKLVEAFQKQPEWATADTVVLGHSDRWDAGPPVNFEFSWQEFIAFDQWLREKKYGQLAGHTKSELIKEVNEKYLGPWSMYHLERYVQTLTTLRDTFAAAGKKLLITAQGCPLVPPQYAKIVSEVVRGTSDDCTWGMENNDPITTVGRQMGSVAFNPFLAMSTLAHWDYNSSVLNNGQWRGPIGTTEPSRRTLYDRAFRGVVRLDGQFTSIHSYGYNVNVGDPFTLTDIDYTQWKRVRDLHSLLMPEAPLGAGIVIANSYLNDPQQMRFQGSNPGATDETKSAMQAVGKLERAGISVPFSANVLSLAKWKGKSPLIILNLQKMMPDEIALLQQTLDCGIRVAALCHTDEPIPVQAAALFGVDAKGVALPDAKIVGQVDGRDIVVKNNAMFVPLDSLTMTQPQIDSIAATLQGTVQSPLTFDAGSTGYGFVSNGQTYIVVEDWREEARVIHVRLRASSAASITAVGVNDHVRLPVQREGDDWVISIPTRPGDGNLICVQEN